jgi:hypothetical protein
MVMARDDRSGLDGPVSEESVSVAESPAAADGVGFDEN